jgi:hypothetical protein
MNSFRFGLWVGFVTSIVFAALWYNEPEWDFEPSTTEMRHPQNTIVSEDATLQLQSE